MKQLLKKIISSTLIVSVALSLAACSNTNTASSSDNTKATPLSNYTAPGDPENVPESLKIDWNKRYHYDELENQLSSLHEEAPDITELYSIGSSWQERKLWCLEITNESIPKEEKTGIGVFAAIHGEERESASTAIYTAWWMILNRDTEYIQSMLDQYIIYVIPVINPDGYEQSFTYFNRPNLRPADANHDDVTFSDPYSDIDGDGFIAAIYSGTADVIPSHKISTDWTKPWLGQFGVESPDWDGNNILGDDPKNSGIDMNRNFNYQWNRFDADTVNGTVVGSNSWYNAGPSAASEPEVQAVQHFIDVTPMEALVSMHTGMQAVFYPWCYREYEPENPDDADLPFMKDTAAKMAEQFIETTGRGCYSMNSYQDYPTSAELIDYAYGHYNIHAYTLEVYAAGGSGAVEENTWGDTLPAEKWIFYSQDDIKNKLGLDPSALISADTGEHLAENEGLWFYVSNLAQMVNRAPEDQETMLKGGKDAVLVMIESELNDGVSNYQRPFLYK